MFSREEFEREHKEELEQRRKELINVLEQENLYLEIEQKEEKQ